VFKFITNRPFWVNLLAAAALALLLVFAFVHMLSWITRHGEHLTVPDVRNKNTEEAIKLLKDQGFDVMIQDSVYTDTLPKGIVIKQLPDPDATVKVNRTVFLTVNREVPPMIEMPDLKGQGLTFALDVLRRNHLQLEDTIFKTDFMKGSVLEQEYQGNKINKGQKVPWGSGITLVVGAGLGDTYIAVPDLVGMTYGEARTLLDSLGITPVPVMDNSVTDTVSAFIYKQHPTHLDDLNNPAYIKPGMFMDLSLSKEMINLKDSAGGKINN
jgi:beta-lactam-binding protein with PASTA domain